MKLILAAVAALLLLAAPASAGVVAHKSGESAESIRAYWTPERMRNATPAKRDRAGGPKAQAGKPGGGTSTSWSTLAVTWPATDPKVYAHGKVFFRIGTGSYVCSGTAVGENTVWTAGHCVNEGPGEFYSGLTFVPAYNSNGVQRPYGTFPQVTLYTTTEWKNTSPTAYGHDLGAARVTTNEAGQTLGTALGAGNVRAVDTGGAVATGTRLKSYGYPAEGKYSGQTEYVCDSYVSRRDSSATPPTYGIPCGMNGGSSGGGWVNTAGAVMSVNSYGYGSIKNTMFGPVQASSAAALLAAAS